MVINNNMGLADLEEISNGVAGVADLLSAISAAQDKGDSFDKGIYFLQLTAQNLADRLHEYTIQEFAAANAAPKS